MISFILLKGSFIPLNSCARQFLANIVKAGVNSVFKGTIFRSKLIHSSRRVHVGSTQSNYSVRVHHDKGTCRPEE